MTFMKKDTHMEIHDSFMSEAVTKSLSVFFAGGLMGLKSDNHF